MAAISAGAIVWRNKRPYFFVGWFWYLGILAPVIGIIQISEDASHADRYTYLSEIGLAIAVTWAVSEWSTTWKHRRVILGSLMMAAMSALTVCGHIQTSYWKDDQSLWTHTLACTGDNFAARMNLGHSLAGRGELDEAIVQYQNAVNIRPDYAEGHYNLANLLSKRGKPDEAIAEYHKALDIEPDKIDALNNLGNALVVKGAYREAIAQFRKVIEIQPDFTQAHYNLGNLLLKRGKLDEAIAQYRKALEMEPERTDVLNNLGNALAGKGDDAAAIAQYQKV